MNKNEVSKTNDSIQLLPEALPDSYAQDMAWSVDVSEAGKNLPELAEKVQSGEEILVSRDGLPIMKLVPVQTSSVRLRGAKATEFKLGYAADHLKDFDWDEWDRLDEEMHKIWRKFGYMD